MPKGKELRGSLLWRKGRPELQNEDPHLNCLSDAKRQEIVLEKRLAQTTMYETQSLSKKKKIRCYFISDFAFPLSMKI